jgi:hypothetical protein
MKMQPQPRPWLFSLGGVLEESIVPSHMEPSAMLENPAKNSDDDDDQYQHWCNDNVFKAGGVRSVPGKLNVVVPIL